VGWMDSGGFDLLRVAAGSSSQNPGFGNFQAIAIDDIRAQIDVSNPLPTKTVPEPTTLTLLSIGFLSLSVSSRRRKAA